MVGPRIMAFDAAIMTKSFPVMPKRTSLASVDCQRQDMRFKWSKSSGLTCLRFVEFKENEEGWGSKSAMRGEVVG